MKTSTKIFFAKFLSNITRLFFELYGKNSREIKIKRNNILFLVDLNEGIDFAIFLNLYERKVVKFYSKIINPNFNIIDIGSNIGFHTLNFANLLSTGKVFSIEPTSFAVKKLKKNISLNTLLKKKIICDQIFLSNSKKNFKKKIYASWPLKNNIKVHPVLMGAAKDASKSKIESLDNYIFRKKIKNLNLIKIDVDGNEFDIINSGKETIKKFKPIIMFEFCPYLHKDNDLDFLIKFFNKLNYSFIDSSNSREFKLNNVNDLKRIISFGSSKNVFLIPN
tara:strand:- start:4155 stop:4988 length:834 start_codon:yes stop_codon:yes gene_type:complete